MTSGFGLRQTRSQTSSPSLIVWPCGNNSLCEIVLRTVPTMEGWCEDAMRVWWTGGSRGPGSCGPLMEGPKGGRGFAPLLQRGLGGTFILRTQEPPSQCWGTVPGHTLRVSSREQGRNFMLRCGQKGQSLSSKPGQEMSDLPVPTPRSWETHRIRAMGSSLKLEKGDGASSLYGSLGSFVCLGSHTYH